MRRTVFHMLGFLEIICSVFLFAVVWLLPGPTNVYDRVGRIERVGRQTSAQVRNLRNQVHLLGQSQPGARRLADDMQVQLQRLGDNLKDENVGQNALQATSDSLGAMAQGLDGLAASIPLDGFHNLGQALGTGADLLDNQAIQGAVETADRLEKSIATLRNDAKLLNDYVQAAPKDLARVWALHDALVRLCDNLDQLSTTVEPKSVEAMSRGLVDFQNALTAGADRLSTVAGMSYPIVGLEGVWPTVSYRKLWPEGQMVAAALRKASKSAGTTRKELDAVLADLPRLRETLNDSRQTTARARDLLAAAAKNRDRMEELLKDLPRQTAALANDLPKVGDGLTRLLRETTKLREVATALRKGREDLGATAPYWTNLRKSLTASADLLRNTQRQMQMVLDNRPRYESSLENSRRLVEGLSAAVPIYTQQFGEDLEEQERRLDTLGQSIDDATAGLPEVGVMGAHLLIMTRLFLSFLGAIFLLHGGYLALSPAMHSGHHGEPGPIPSEAG